MIAGINLTDYDKQMNAFSVDVGVGMLQYANARGVQIECFRSEVTREYRVRLNGHVVETLCLYDEDLANNREGAMAEFTAKVYRAVDLLAKS